MAEAHNVQHFSSVRGTDGRTRIHSYCDWKTCICFVFLPVSYFFDSITLTSYTFYALFCFFFFYSVIAHLGIRLHQPDRECFPVFHQPSCLFFPFSLSLSTYAPPILSLAFLFPLPPEVLFPILAEASCCHPP